MQPHGGQCYEKWTPNPFINKYPEKMSVALLHWKGINPEGGLHSFTHPFVHWPSLPTLRPPHGSSMIQQQGSLPLSVKSAKGQLFVWHPPPIKKRTTRTPCRCPVSRRGRTGGGNEGPSVCRLQQRAGIRMPGNEMLGVDTGKEHKQSGPFPHHGPAWVL